MGRATGPEGSGAEGSPVGDGPVLRGPLPRVDAAGLFPDAIRLYNLQFIEVHNLEITNHGNRPAIRRGVHIFLDNFGTAQAYCRRRTLHP